MTKLIDSHNTTDHCCDAVEPCHDNTNRLPVAHWHQTWCRWTLHWQNWQTPTSRWTNVLTYSSLVDGPPQPYGLPPEHRRLSSRNWALSWQNPLTQTSPWAAVVTQLSQAMIKFTDFHQPTDTVVTQLIPAWLKLTESQQPKNSSPATESCHDLTLVTLFLTTGLITSGSGY